MTLDWNWNWREELEFRWSADEVQANQRKESECKSDEGHQEQSQP